MSITLTNAAVLSINGAVAESDANAELYYLELSFPSSVRLFYGFGTAVGSVFTPGTQLPNVIVTVNLLTGVWASTNGLSGTASGAGFTAVQNDFLALVNIAETFAVNNNIVVGTTVPWTSSVY
jgi:hypothetical protein